MSIEASTRRPATVTHTTVTPSTKVPTDHAITTRRPVTHVITTRKPTHLIVTTRRPTSHVITTRKPTIHVITTRKPTTHVITTRKSHVITTTKPTTTISSTTRILRTSTTSMAPCQPTDSCAGHYMCDDTGVKVCHPGYKGPECTERDYSGQVDPNCPDKFKCRNGGTCWNKTCCCPTGYDGKYCQKDIDECKSQPCQNGGFCKDEVGHYRCECGEGKMLWYIDLGIEGEAF